jgi:outer membrane receptor protein involved in Fe transport
MADLVQDWQGSWTSRLLVAYQPVINKQTLVPGTPWTRTPDPITRLTAMLNYNLNSWHFGLQDTWVSGFSQVAGPVLPLGSTVYGTQSINGLNNWVNPRVKAFNQTDINISRDFGDGLTGYFVVQNLFNAMPDYIPNGTIGQLYPVYSNGYAVQSPMGRYFTIGIRGSL